MVSLLPCRVISLHLCGGRPCRLCWDFSSRVFTFLRGSFQYPGRQRLSYQCSGNQMKDEREEVSVFSLWNAYVHPLFSNCLNFYLNFKTSRESLSCTFLHYHPSEKCLGGLLIQQHGEREVWPSLLKQLSISLVSFYLHFTWL